MPVLSLVENIRRKQIAWVNAVLVYRQWNRSRLAREGGFSHSTLSKFFNDKEDIAQLETTIVEKIARVGGIPPYQTEAPERARGLAESEATPYTASPSDPVAAAIAALKAGRNGLDPWVLQSRALETAGYVPGDILMVDLNAEPKDGDAVCAQVYDRQGKAETVMRLYEDPFLVAATNDKHLMRPLLVDRDRVMVRGVVVASMRPRRAA